MVRSLYQLCLCGYVLASFKHKKRAATFHSCRCLSFTYILINWMGMFIILVQQDKKDERNERYECKRRNRLDGGMTAVVTDVMITICLFYNIISALTTLFSGNVAKEFNDVFHNGPSQKRVVLLLYYNKNKKSTICISTISKKLFSPYSSFILVEIISN